MFIHSVYFWLRDDLSQKERQEFVAGLTSLPGIDTVRHGYIGVPGRTDRPIIDRTYSHGLVLVFDDRAGHDAYQEHPVHQAFVETCSGFWKDIKIYDCVTE